ncbi:hypothetical protein AB3U99_20755 [Niallia sp. JL1B1071]|uniref:hypothetical protein n=1 Tax=Niallia tiangongensis TaxID=3237105 RepID=UPI0037DC01F1
MKNTNWVSDVQPHKSIVTRKKVIAGISATEPTTRISQERLTEMGYKYPIFLYINLLI